MGPTIFVVVPVFNRKALLATFLGCMRAQRFRSFQVVVVDDGSTDGTAQLIETAFPEVRLVRGDGTLWWTGAINAGIRHAMSRGSPNDAVVVINDDVTVDETYLATLYRLWQTMPDTLIGSVVADVAPPGRIVDGGRIVNWWTAKLRLLHVGRSLLDFPAGHCEEVSALTGWGTLIPMPVFGKIGLFNDAHFQQCGDTELPVRASRAGFRLIVSYDAVVNVRVNETAGVNVADRYRLRDLWTYFFDVKSNFRLKYRWYFAKDTATSTPAFASFVLFDLIRITGHFLMRLRLN
jgi:GT2 family glycosyltransferase